MCVYFRLEVSTCFCGLIIDYNRGSDAFLDCITLGIGNICLLLLKKNVTSHIYP